MNLTTSKLFVKSMVGVKKGSTRVRFFANYNTSQIFRTLESLLYIIRLFIYMYYMDDIL